jgi:hypothetical protein
MPAGGRIIERMLRSIFRRRKLTQVELAEQERLRRDAAKARHEAEAEIAMQRGKIEGYLDRHPPDAGGPY